MTASIDRSLYNQLPSLEQASMARQTDFVDGLMAGPLRDVFLRNDAHLTFSLYLQHRHHNVGVDQAVVKVQGTAHLMDSKTIEETVCLGNKVVPATWMTDAASHRVVPMEFSVVPAAANTPSPTCEFIDDLASVLAANECEHLFGIDIIAKQDWSEINVGNASVVVPIDDCSARLDGKRFIPVSFVFSETEPGYRVHGRCGKDHDHTRAA